MSEIRMKLLTRFLAFFCFLTVIALWYSQSAEKNDVIIKELDRDASEELVKTTPHSLERNLTTTSTTKKRRKLVMPKTKFRPKVRFVDMALSVWARRSKGQPKVRLLLVCYWRGGSSFLSDVLQYYPTTYYTFEPFHSLGTDISTKQAHEVLTNLLTCQYDKLQFLLEWMKLEENEWLARWNRHYWNLCKLQNRDTCFDPSFASKVCKLSVLNLVKTIRIGLKDVENLLDEKDVKVVHLVRDPRGLYASRQRAEPGYGKDWNAVESMCQRLIEDHRISLKLRKDHPDNFLQIRYEDFSRDPLKVTMQLMTFAGLTKSERVQKHLIYNTRARASDVRNMYSTKRNSSTVWYGWRDRLSPDVVARLQETCKPFFENMGYKIASENEDLANFYPLTDAS